MTAGSQRLLFATINMAAVAAHPLRSALSGAGIAMGVMLLFASLLYNASLTGSFADMTHDLVGTTGLEVTSIGSAPFDASAVDRVRAVPGVDVSAPLLVAHTHVRGPKASLEVIAVAFDSQLARLGPSVKRTRPVRGRSGNEGVVVTRQLLDLTGQAADGTVRIVANGVETPLPIVAIERSDVGDELNGGRFIALPLAIGQRIFRERGAVSSILIGTRQTSPSQLSDLGRRLRAALGDAVRVDSPDQRLHELDQSSAQIRYAAAFFSALALLISAYLMFTTVTMTVIERRHELAMLLVLGDRRHRILLRLLAETALIGCGGVGVGLLLGWALGHYVFTGMPRYLQDSYGFQARPMLPWWAIAAAAGAGLATALLGACLPALAVLRLPPLEALRRQPLGERVVAYRRSIASLIAGVLLLVLGALGAHVFPDLALPLVCLLFAGGALAAPAGFDLMLRLLARLLVAPRWHRGQAIASIAGASLDQGRGRSVATISAAALSLAMVVTVGALATSVQDTIDRYGDKFDSIDLVATAGDDTYSSVPFDEQIVPRARSVPGVAAAYPYRSTFINWRDHRVLLAGWDPDELQVLNFDLDSGTPAEVMSSLRHNGALVSAAVARREHLAPGAVISLPTSVGQRLYRVAGVVEYWSWPEGAILVNDAAFVRDFRQSQVNALDLRLEPGASRAGVAGQLHQLAPELIVQNGSIRRAQVVVGESSLFAPFFRIRDVMVLVAILAVFNTMLIAALQRTAELGVLRAIGAVGSQLMGVLVLEAAAMVVIAFVAGTFFGMFIYGMSSPLLEATTGLSVPWTVTPGSLLVAAGAATLIWVAGSAYPAWVASHRVILDALAYE